MKKMGIVLQWDSSKGVGTIMSTDDGEWFFCHYSSIQTTSKIKNLTRGYLVKFSTYKNFYSEKVLKIKQIDEVFDTLENMKLLNDVLNTLVENEQYGAFNNLASKYTA